MLCVDIQNCASCLGGEHMLRKIVKKSCRKVKNEAERSKMASVMGIFAGLVGPKTENDDFS